jgi:hypothetical protein
MTDIKSQNLIRIILYYIDILLHNKLIYWFNFKGNVHIAVNKFF